MEETKNTIKKEEIKIDVKNISNIDAMKGINPSVKDFSDKADNSSIESKKEEKINELQNKGYELEHFEKYPRKYEFVQPEKIALPSHGIPYSNCDDEDVKNGYIWLYPMTMKEEEILSTNKYIYEGTATIMALNNCIKSNINAMDLVISDFYYLLIRLRQLSISDKFSFDIECPHCGYKFNHEIKISDINFDELDNDYKEPKRIDLPQTGSTVLIGLPRIKTIREMSWMINNSTTDVGLAEFFYTRTFAVITKDGEEVPKEDWIVFFNNLPHKDNTILVDELTFDSGISHIIKEAKCPNCGETIEGSAVELNTDALFRYEQ